CLTPWRVPPIAKSSSLPLNVLARWRSFFSNSSRPSKAQLKLLHEVNSTATGHRKDAKASCEAPVAPCLKALQRRQGRDANPAGPVFLHRRQRPATMCATDHADLTDGRFEQIFPVSFQSLTLPDRKNARRICWPGKGTAGNDTLVRIGDKIAERYRLLRPL